MAIFAVIGKIIILLNLIQNLVMVVLNLNKSFIQNERDDLAGDGDQINILTVLHVTVLVAPLHYYKLFVCWKGENRNKFM